MSFRDRVRKFVRHRSSSSRSTQSSSQSSSSSSSYDPSDKSSPLYYQPGEKIPYKYRRPVDPVHQAQLESFSFGSSIRRRSIASQYSPMGSRLPSRQGSLVGQSTSSRLRTSFGVSGGDGNVTDDSPPVNHLTPIESVSTTRTDTSTSSQASSAAFTQEELDCALRRGRPAIG